MLTTRSSLQLTFLVSLVTVGHLLGCSSAVSPDQPSPPDTLPLPVFTPSADAIAFGQFKVKWAPSGSGQALRQIRQVKILSDELTSTEGSRLVLSIRDFEHPGLQCSMASGDCAGIRLQSTDGRTNRLIVDLGQGAESLWLREGGVLNLQPEST